jgi:tRNA pseudouridine38-40 synthase
MDGPDDQRWKLVLEYDGTDFVGWEVQPGHRSVQGAIEEALAGLLGHPVRVSVSGRTDAGVHALAQVASVRTPVRRSARAMRDGLNARLPADVACVRAEGVPLDFDPRRGAREKHYRYTFLDRPARSPLRRDRAWHLRRPLDAGAMHEAAQALVGTHDFAAFRASGCGARSTVRTLPGWRVVRRDSEIHLDVRGHGFLRHMIRIVAGSLVEVGLGRRPVGWMARVLEGRDRTAAGPTAPARGLCLVSVRYPELPPGPDAG